MEQEGYKFDLSEPLVHDVSPYDASYPVVLFSNGIKKELMRAQDAVHDIYCTVLKEMPVLTQVQHAMDRGCRYVVDASESTLKALESGALKLTQENGMTFAQLRNANGQYGSRIPIKKEVFSKGFDTMQLANALQMQAIQDQIQAIANQLILIEGGVRDILQGQQNDRIALYYSGLSLFLESKNVLNEALKNALQAEALRALAESTFQLKMTMGSDIRYIAMKEYDKVKEKRKLLLRERMNSINQSFAFIHQATILRAGIYCDLGEHGSMMRVLEEYSRFIDADIAENIALLSLHDEKDDGTPTGLWATRSRLSLKVAEISKAISNPQKTLYIGVAEEASNE